MSLLLINNCLTLTSLFVLLCNFMTYFLEEPTSGQVLAIIIFFWYLNCKCVVSSVSFLLFVFLFVNRLKLSPDTRTQNAHCNTLPRIQESVQLGYALNRTVPEVVPPVQCIFVRWPMVLSYR